MRQFGLVLDGTWRDDRRNVLMGNDPEKVSNMQKTKPNQTMQEGRDEKLC